MYYKMTTLVTGGSGLVGTAIKRILDESSAIFVSSAQYDLTKMDDTKRMFETYRPTRVIHLAACVGGLFKNMTYKVKMLEDNLMINFNVVKCCHDYGVEKLIACLSTCIFPDKTTYPIDETMLHNGPPHSSNDAYAYAKRMLQIHCKTYRDAYGDNFVCIIPTNVYGIHDNYSLVDGHVIPAPMLFGQAEGHKVCSERHRCSIASVHILRRFGETNRVDNGKLQ